MVETQSVWIVPLTGVRVISNLDTVTLNTNVSYSTDIVLGNKFSSKKFQALNQVFQSEAIRPVVFITLKLLMIP